MTEPWLPLKPRRRSFAPRIDRPANVLRQARAPLGRGRRLGNGRHLRIGIELRRPQVVERKRAEEAEAKVRRLEIELEDLDKIERRIKQYLKPEDFLLPSGFSFELPDDEDTKHH